MARRIARPGHAAPIGAPRRMLVIKLADLGDAILTTPMIGTLRRTWPSARIEVLTTPQAAVAFHASGLIDAVHTLDVHRRMRDLSLARRVAAVARVLYGLRRQRFDAIVLGHPLVTRRGAFKHAALVLAVGAPVRAGLAAPGSARGWFLTHRAVDPGYDRAHVVDAMRLVARAIGASGADAPPRFDVEAAIARAADGLLAPLRAPNAPPLSSAGALTGRWVAIHPGSGAYSPARRWSPAGFAGVARALAAAGARVILVGTAGDDGAAVRAAGAPIDLDLTGATDVPTLAAVLRRCDLLVANDGGVMHVAAAVGTPVVAVFGPSNDVAWGPWPPARTDAPSPHRIVTLDVPCRPCLYVGHRLGSPSGCPTRDCLRWLAEAPVIAACFDVLTGGPSVPARERPPSTAEPT